MKVFVNGKERELTHGARLAELAAADGAAVAFVNGSMLAREQWDAEPLREGDSIALVALVAGG